MTVQQHERRGEQRGRDDGKTWIDSMNKALLIIVGEREKKEEERITFAILISTRVEI